MVKGSSAKATSRSTARTTGGKAGWLIALVVLAAIIMGAPTIGGDFVGGDDQSLVLHHVLVNHPSISHAVELFRIIHRDLYQPLPMLSFQIEFATAKVFGLFDESSRGGAWLFHLTNIFLHGVNVVFVWLVIASFHRKEADASRYLLATVAAMVFAIHPLQSEVVAWINGRMMLMSTLFALVSLLTLERWLREGRWWWAIWTILFVTFSAISKIRIGLPVLLFVAAFAHGSRLNARFYAVWLVGAVVTGVFVFVNLGATEDAGMFKGAGVQLHGSRIARSMLTLSWYFRHMLWPTGLASWYPSPYLVQWSDPTIRWATLTVFLTMTVAAWTIRLRRQAVFGWLWFFATIASTLPLVPARNALAADRYMYLPIIGLAWVVSLVGQRIVSTVLSLRSRSLKVAIGVSFGLVLPSVMIATSWHTASFYSSKTLKCERIAKLFPETPHVWERAASLAYDEGRYETAIDLAGREFAHDKVSAKSMALMIIGQSQFELGKMAQGVASLREAIETVPENSRAKFALGIRLDEMGQTDEGLSWIEASVRAAPLANPRLIRLATLYRRLERPEDARRSFEQAVANNPYEVPAVLGLTELDIEEGTEQSLAGAGRRLIDLLAWMPENADAWADLGVVESTLGRPEQAIEAYKRALQEDASHATAALNLALLYQNSGDPIRAGEYLTIAARGSLESFEQLVALHDALVAHG
ncbi:MAG: tetratricopeptide repeat protein, partial [Planctomycetes bacterium]|nr:tetratricopeptide repeat protein [Planctomycetota bacterium]